MSNPTELPDLAEAVRKLVKAKGRFHTEQNYKELADALARYDARRAQPEGEAPQAEKWRHAANEWADTAYNGLQHLRNIEDGITEAQAARANMEKCCQHASAVAQAAATLSPLCGAQHAESGKEAEPNQFSVRDTVDIVTAVMDQFGFLCGEDEHSTQELCEALEAALSKSARAAQLDGDQEGSD